MSVPSAQSPSESSDGKAAPVAWRLLLVPAVLQFVLHVLTSGNYGIFRDEYYYLACANNLDWGYVDQPPLSILLLAGWTKLFGDSVDSIRILPALCGSGLILLTGMVAAELGGRRWAQLCAGFAAGIGGLGLVIGGFYSMNCIDGVVWVTAYLLVVRIARTGDGRWWPWLGLVISIGLFNKIGLLVFGLALAIGVLVTSHRKHLRDRRLWFAGGIAFLGLLPYLLWNVSHDWATQTFMDNATQYKIADFSPWSFLGECTLEANPGTVSLWVAGLGWLLVAPRARRFRLLGIMFLATFAILVMQKSKPYYMATAFPVMFAAGAVAWESWTGSRRWLWVRGLLLLNLGVGLGIFGPFAVPILSIEGSVAYMERIGIAPSAAEVGHTAPAPQYFADRFGWEEFARDTSAVYLDLSEEERPRCVIVGSNYGHGGALQYWSRDYELPPVYSRHNNFWLWGPPPGVGDIVIVTGFGSESLEGLFDEVTLATESIHPWSQETRIPVWVCRGLREPWPAVWERIQLFI